MLRAQRPRLLAGTPAESHTQLLVLGRGDAIIGSASRAAVRMDDEQIAPRHALIRYRGGKYFLKPFGSEGGTFLNGTKIKRARRLEHGDALRFGPFSYRFIDPDELTRMRNRRIVRAAAIAVLIVGIAVAHLKAWDAPLLPYAEQLKQMDWRLSAPTNGPAPATDSPLKTHVEMVTRAEPIPATDVHTVSSAKDVHAASVVVRSEARVATAAPKEPQWLEEFNRFRTMAGLTAVAETSQMTASVDAHANYLMANFGEQMRTQNSIGDSAYNEDRNRGGYSADGAAAAPNSQVAWGCGAEDEATQIDKWIAGPFHRMTMLSPSLKQAGFAQTFHDGCWVAALRMPPEGERPGLYPKPVEFPPDGATVALTITTGETPDPLSGCPNFAAPAGLPITLQIGWMADAKLGSTALTEDGKAVEECSYDAQSYQNPAASEREYGRWALRSHGAIVMIPRAPLKPGAVYAVSIAANDETYTWSFKVAAQ